MQLRDLVKAVEVDCDVDELPSLNAPPHPHEVPSAAVYGDDPSGVLRCEVCKWPAMVCVDGFQHLDSRLNP